MTSASRRSDGIGAASRWILLAGAAGSVGLMLYTGRHNRSTFLLLMFVLWVVAPFGGLALAAVLSARWAAPVRRLLSWLIVVVAAGSIAAYLNDILHPPRGTAAFIYVAVPLVAWLLIGLLLPAAVWWSGRRAGG